jgi:transposase InsO family protein
VHRALCARLGQVSLRLVRERVQRVKAHERARRRRAEAARRESLAVLVRDGVWSGDATHVGRDVLDGEVQAVCVREVRSTRTLDVAVGPPATALDVVAQLDRCVAQRGGPPLVFWSDNGPPYTDERVARWMERHGVVHLFNLPHTPRHNAAVEHGHRELKAECGLGKGSLLGDVPARQTSVREFAPGAAPGAGNCVQGPASLLEAGARATGRALRGWMRQLLGAWQRLDEARLRASRGWRTAIEHDAQGPPAASVVDRQAFYAAAHCAMCAAGLASGSKRARRLAVRVAGLEAMERFHVIKRSRGGLPGALQKCEGIS